MMSEPFRFVHVNADGTVRELHESERRYLQTEFKGGDGAAPYIKSRYDERNGWNELTGYLERRLLPEGMATAAAPADDPIRPLDRGEYIAWLRGKGVEVIENADGSLTVKRR